MAYLHPSFSICKPCQNPMGRSGEASTEHLTHKDIPGPRLLTRAYNVCSVAFHKKTKEAGVSPCQRQMWSAAAGQPKGCRVKWKHSISTRLLCFG